MEFVWYWCVSQVNGPPSGLLFLVLVLLGNSFLTNGRRWVWTEVPLAKVSMYDHAEERHLCYQVSVIVIGTRARGEKRSRTKV
jgi:hypothetical protein